MPVLKIKKANGTWQEVWGATNSGSGGCSTPILTTVNIVASKWQGANSPYYQAVTCNGVGVNSKVDLQPTPEQLVELQDAEISLMAANNNGFVTIYAFNDKPQNDMTMQVLITEVSII